MVVVVVVVVVVVAAAAAAAGAGAAGREGRGGEVGHKNGGTNGQNAGVGTGVKTSKQKGLETVFLKKKSKLILGGTWDEHRSFGQKVPSRPPL